MVNVRVIWVKENQAEYVAWVDEPHQFEVRVHTSKVDMKAAVEWWCERRGVTPDYYDMTAVKKSVRNDSAAIGESSQTKETTDASWGD